MNLVVLGFDHVALVGLPVAAVTSRTTPFSSSTAACRLQDGFARRPRKLVAMLAPGSVTLTLPVPAAGREGRVKKACRSTIRRLPLNIVRLMDDKLSIRRRFKWAAQMPEYRLKLVRRPRSPVSNFKCDCPGNALHKH